MAVDRILRRNFWALLVVFVAAAAFLDARAVGRLVGTVLSAQPGQLAVASLAQQKPARAAAPSAHAVSAEALFSRNPFDSQSGPLDPQLRVGPDALDVPPDLLDPMNAPACEGVKVLIITKAENPDWSFAAFGERAAGADRTILRRRNGDVGDKKVEFVGQDRVWLKTANARCQAKLWSPVDPVEPAAASTLDPVFTRGIKKTGPDEFDVDRAVLDKILEDQADLMRTTRIVPERENGTMVGIRLFGVKEGSLLALLGMENGDRLQQVNGVDVSSPEKALEAYVRLGDAHHLSLQVNRRGANKTIEYRIE